MEHSWDYSKVDPGVFIGTNACCQTHFEEELLDRGVDADISLEGERMDAPYGANTYVWLPTVDHTPPSWENAEVGVDAIDRLVRQGRQLYLHCLNGHGRAPTLYAAYLIAKRSRTPEEAVEHIRQSRPTIHLEDSQWAFLREWAAKSG